MLRILLVRPGATDFDEQGRIKGTLDIPLNGRGEDQVAQTAIELASEPIDVIYSSPCQSAQQTARVLAGDRPARVKVLDKLQNLNHGLWHGKRIEEVKQCQPKVYRQWQENPGAVCPPEGESVKVVQQRVRDVISRLFKKHRQGCVAIVAPEPVVSLMASQLQERAIGNLWEVECESGGWEVIEVEPTKVTQVR